MRNTHFRGGFIGLIAIFGLFVGCDQGAKFPTTGPAVTAATRPNTADGKVVLSDAEWKKILTKDQYYVLRQKGTDTPFKNAFFNNTEKGVYKCAGCGELLFSSDNQYDSHEGWPSFWKPIAADHVKLTTDADGERTEVTCPICGGHLGHLFNDGPQPTGKRYCIDSSALLFIPGPSTTQPAK
jgi:peptide-methionine (R)-S-oxide reductase